LGTLHTPKKKRLDIGTCILAIEHESAFLP
jgi:hypothetical protein